MPDLTEQIAQNVAAVRTRIADAAAACGRHADEIALVAIREGATLVRIGSALYENL